MTNVVYKPLALVVFSLGLVACSGLFERFTGPTDVTIPLNPADNQAAYDKLEPLDTLTLSPGEDPFQLTLTWHSSTTPAADTTYETTVDMHKYVHHDIPDGPECLRLVNAYFGEFGRRGKTIRLTDGRGDGTQDAIDRRLSHHFERIERRRGSSNAMPEVSRLQLTNNCREPGNFEYKLLGRANGEPEVLVKGHFLLPLDYYDELLKADRDGIGVDEQRTGVIVSRYDYDRDPAISDRYGEHGGEPFVQVADKSFPTCHVDALDAVGSYDGRALTGRVRSFDGPIDYATFDDETQYKSGSTGDEPISYVRVTGRDCPPAGFTPPDTTPGRRGRPAPSDCEGVAPAGVAYWRRNPGHVVPHVFQSYADTRTYDLHVSAFEINGRYTGHTSEGGNVTNDNGGRLDVDHRYLEGMSRYEIRTGSDGRTQLRVHNDAGGPGLIVGNLELDVGESTFFLLGYGSQPIIARYDAAPAPMDRYAFLVDADGNILDHYDSEYSIGTIYVRRTRTGYVLDLIAHERIVPVYRAVLATGPDGGKGAKAGRGGKAGKTGKRR